MDYDRRSTFRPGGFGYEPLRGRRHPWLLAFLLVVAGATLTLVASGPAKSVGGALLVFGVIGALVGVLQHSVANEDARRDG